MQKLLVGGAAALGALLAVGAASAADLPARKGPILAPAYAPIFSWTGFYAGLNAGYSFNNNKAVTTGTPGFLALGPTNVPGSLGVGKNGFIGGAQVGYNQQYGQFVVGAEADIQYVDGKRGRAFTNPVTLGGLTTAAGSELNYLGTVRARLGYTASDRLLIYVTGGLAYGNPKNTGTVLAAGPGAQWAGSNNTTRFGYTIGAGAEYALTNNWTAKLEYLYYDLGKQTVTANQFAGAALPGIAYQARYENSGSLVRAGVNYKF